MTDSPLAVSAYEVLGVASDVDDEQLRKAYRQRLRQSHPDTGGDATLFVQVQRAWQLIGTPEARAAYDRGHGYGKATAPQWSVWRPPERAQDTRPVARSHGQPGGWNRERFLIGAREWAGRGATVPDPYDPAFVRAAPRELKLLLADALAEEQTARTVATLGMGYTVWHDVAVPKTGGKLDHVVLGPSGLYALTSADTGTPVRFRRGEVIDEAGATQLVAELVRNARQLGRAAGVRFGGGIVVLPDDDLAEPITQLGKVRALPIAVVGQGALQAVLRRGVAGVADLGGTAIFDIRSRLQQAIRFA